jgi:hypothetical protein
MLQAVTAQYVVGAHSLVRSWIGSTVTDLGYFHDWLVIDLLMHGPAGAGNLNQLLQEALTPSRDGAPERRYGGRVFRIGDKVTQLRDNYDKGTVGVLTAPSASSPACRPKTTRSPRAPTKTNR